MLNSRAIDDLRPDVAANCRILLELCKQQGLNVLITQTLRDDEYQATLYAQGRTQPGSIITKSKITTFHGVGLAFDVCKNVKGHEYDDAAFFANVAIIAKAMGFSWGGDWEFVDVPHFQWDDQKRYNGTMVRSGKLPPEMEEYMTYDMFKKYMEQYRAEQGRKSVSAWAKAAWDKLTRAKVTDGSRPQDLITREEAAVMMDRILEK